jgi:hypothetical protein
MPNPKIEWYSWKEKNQKAPLMAFITELENGILIIISDTGARIGTIAIGTSTQLIESRINTSSIPIVFGIRNELLARAVAERVAHQCQKIVIASVYLKDESSELAQRALQCGEESIREYLKNKEL